MKQNTRCEKCGGVHWGDWCPSIPGAPVVFRATPLYVDREPGEKVAEPKATAKTLLSKKRIDEHHYRAKHPEKYRERQKLLMRKRKAKLNAERIRSGPATDGPQS